jgi:hypothetical protein
VTYEEYSTSKVTAYLLEDRGLFPVRGKHYFPITIVSRTVLGFIHPNNQWLLELVSTKINLAKLEADQLPSSRAGIQNMWKCKFRPVNAFSWCGSYAKGQNLFFTSCIEAEALLTMSDNV